MFCVQSWSYCVFREGLSCAEVPRCTRVVLIHVNVISVALLDSVRNWFFIQKRFVTFTIKERVYRLFHSANFIWHYLKKLKCVVLLSHGVPTAILRISAFSSKLQMQIKFAWPWTRSGQCSDAFLCWNSAAFGLRSSLHWDDTASFARQTTIPTLYLYVEELEAVRK